MTATDRDDSGTLRAITQEWLRAIAGIRKVGTMARFTVGIGGPLRVGIPGPLPSEFAAHSGGVHRFSRLTEANSSEKGYPTLLGRQAFWGFLQSTPSSRQARAEAEIEAMPSFADGQMK